MKKSAPTKKASPKKAPTKKATSKKAPPKKDHFNGVTTKWLKELNDRFMEDSWVHTFQYTTIEGIDQLYVCFTDFNGDEWSAIINEYEIVDLSIEVDYWGDGEKLLQPFGSVAFQDFMKYLDSLPLTANKFFQKSLID